jgi:S1-C subfamily serine protease
MTPLVKVIQQIEPAVVALFTPVENQLTSGSGTVIHEDGYVLTNNHVLPMVEGFALLPGSKPIRFRVVGRNPESDIAVVRLLDVKSPMSIVPIGRSSDLMHGESVAVAGNPGGRGTVFTSGIVSGKAVLEGGPNALVMTNYENSRRDTFIQFDAASNRGNSGGPLVNMDGQVIGIVSAGVNGEQNVGLAIPVDRVRRQFEKMLEPELIHQRFVGLRIDAGADVATIASIDNASPASQSGLKPGDIIQAVNESAIRHSVDWLLMLETLLPQNQPLRLMVRREEETMTIQVTPSEMPAMAPVDVPQTRPGLRFASFSGKFEALPDFAALQAERTGIASVINLKEVQEPRPDEFALRFEGLLKIPQEGLYRLVIVSDDGSKLLLHGRTIIDHDGNHPPKPAGAFVRLQQGLHPIVIEYFQGNGAKELRLFLQRCETREPMFLKTPREITEAELFHAAALP